MLMRTFLLLFICLLGLSSVGHAEIVLKDGKSRYQLMLDNIPEPGPLNLTPDANLKTKLQEAIKEDFEKVRPIVREVTNSYRDSSVTSSKPRYLPDTNPEKQYRWALAKALMNDLQTAERAFDEFLKKHPAHELAVDALFYQGKTLFEQKKFEEAATLLSKFNVLYSTDVRVPDSTLWLAESVSHFASREQACAIYDNLVLFVDQPPQYLAKRLNELMNASR